MLDTNLNFIRARKKGQINFKQVANRSLQKVERLGEAISQMKPGQSIDIQDRTLLIGDLVFTIESGKRFVWSQNERTAATYEKTLLRESQDLLCLRSSPGSRRLVLSDQLFINSVASAHQISKDLILLRLTASGQQSKKQNWTLMTTKGNLKDLPDHLLQVLHSENHWSKVQTCMLWDKRIRFVLEWHENELKPSYAIIFTVNESCDLTSY